MILFIDILLDIIDFIHKDVETLKALSLTSSLFRDLCQQRLFASIDLQNDITTGYNSAVPPAFLVQFHDLVTRSPRIASYVWEIGLSQCSILSSGGIRHRTPEIPMMWMNDHSDLVAEVVDTLSSSPIHTLRFFSRREILWTKLDHSRIHCIGPTIGLDLSSLQSLNLDLDLSQISRLGHLFQLPKLTQLKVATFPYASGDPWHLMPAQTLDLSGLPRLTNLALCNNSFEFGSRSNQFEWVGNALESLTATQRLRLESMTMILITTSDGVAKAATLDMMTPLGSHLSRLHQSSDGVKSILVHMKIAWGNDPNVISLAQETILRHLSADWNGREDVLKVKAENDLEWLYRNRSAW